MAAALGWALLLSALAPQDLVQEALDEGRDYLRAIGEQWGQKLPDDLTLGRYFGRRYAGHIKISVRKAPVEINAAFELRIFESHSFQGKSWMHDQRILLGPELEVRWARSVFTEPRAAEHILEIGDKRWTLTSNLGDRIERDEGGVVPAMMWGFAVKYLVLFRLPQGPVGLSRFTAEPSIDRIRPLSGPQKLRIGGQDADGARILVTSDFSSETEWFISKEGTVLEGWIRDGLPIRLRPIAKSAMGRDLEEPAARGEPEKAVARFLHAASQYDRAALFALVDFREIAAIHVPGFDAMEPEERDEAAKKIRETAVDHLLGLPYEIRGLDAALLEEIVACTARTAPAGDEAHVALRDNIFRLKRREGVWRVADVRPTAELRQRTAERSRLAQATLDRLAERWRESDPAIERVLGVYIGRAWLGALRIRIDRAEDGRGFTYAAEHDLSLMRWKYRRRVRYELDSSLNLRSGTIEDSALPWGSAVKVSVDNGRWTAVFDGGGVPFKDEGEAGPGLTGADLAIHLPLFFVPDTRESPLFLTGGEGTCVPKRRSVKVPIRVGGREVLADAFDIGWVGGSARWYLDGAGRPIEMQISGMPFRFRPVEAGEVGRNLEDPLSLAEPQLALVELFDAVKSMDRVEIARAFDLGKVMSRLPGWKDLRADETEERRRQLERSFVEMTMRAFSGLPDRAMLPDVVATLSRVQMTNEDEATVIFDAARFRLVRVKDGPDQGRWIIWEWDRAR